MIYKRFKKVQVKLFKLNYYQKFLKDLSMIYFFKQFIEPLDKKKYF